VMAPWVNKAGSITSGFAAVCLLSDDSCRRQVAQVASDRHTSFTCRVRHRVEYLWAVGPWIETEITVVPPRDHPAPVGTTPCFGENLVGERV
jgi:hypothetical protein